MLKFTSIVGYTSCEPTYIESFLTIFGQCINVLNYKITYPHVKHVIRIFLNESEIKVFLKFSFCFRSR